MNFKEKTDQLQRVKVLHEELSSEEDIVCLYEKIRNTSESDKNELLRKLYRHIYKIESSC